VTQSDQKRALALFRSANTFFERSEYGRALERYRVAVSVWDHPAIHFNMAVCLINLDNPLLANEHLERAMRFGDAPLGAALYAQGLTYRKLLDGRLARLRLIAEQDGVLVTLDGQDLLTGPGERILVLLPGPHQLVAKRRYLPPLTRKLDLPAGVMSVERVVMTRMERRFSSWLPWVVTGSGLAIALVGVGLQFKASSDFDAYDNELARTCPLGCQVGTLPSSLVNREKHARLENTLAITGFAVGGAAIAAGVAMLIFNQPRPIEAEKHIEIQPMLEPGGGGLSLSLGF
jgi:hypothetical protein